MSDNIEVIDVVAWNEIARLRAENERLRGLLDTANRLAELEIRARREAEARCAELQADVTQRGDMLLESVRARREAEATAAAVVDNMTRVVGSLKNYLTCMKFQQTTPDPKSSGFAFAEIPDWCIGQMIDRLDVATLPARALAMAEVVKAADEFMRWNPSMGRTRLHDALAAYRAEPVSQSEADKGMEKRT